MKKGLISFILTLSILFCITNNAKADYKSYGYPTTSIPIKSFSYNSAWQAPMMQSMQNWNNNSEVFFHTLGSINTITAEQKSYDWYGLNKCHYSGSKLLSFEITLNSRTISRDATNINNFIQSVLVHELGHSIWLADNPGTMYNSIMKYGRDRNTMTLPQTYDIQQVNAKY